MDEDSEIGIAISPRWSLPVGYAYAGREWVVERVRQIGVGGAVLDTIHNHHNYAWRETHAGRVTCGLCAKSATPAFPGQRGFVGGSTRGR